MLMACDRYIAIHCNKYVPKVHRKRPPKRAHFIAEKLQNNRVNNFFFFVISCFLESIFQNILTTYALYKIYNMFSRIGFCLFSGVSMFLRSTQRALAYNTFYEKNFTLIRTHKYFLYL